MIADFKLDRESHDLSLDASGRFEFLPAEEGTYQAIKCRLLFFRGENFADSREGTPYFQVIFQKGTDPVRVRAIVRDVIKSVPSVLDVPVCDIAIDRATRAASVTFEARTNTGRVIRSQDYPALIIG